MSVCYRRPNRPYRPRPKPKPLVSQSIRLSTKRKLWESRMAKNVLDMMISDSEEESGDSFTSWDSSLEYPSMMSSQLQKSCSPFGQNGVPSPPSQNKQIATCHPLLKTPFTPIKKEDADGIYDVDDVLLIEAAQQAEENEKNGEAELFVKELTKMSEEEVKEVLDLAVWGGKNKITRFRRQGNLDTFRSIRLFATSPEDAEMGCRGCVDWMARKEDFDGRVFVVKRFGIVILYCAIDEKVLGNEEIHTDLEIMEYCKQRFFVDMGQFEVLVKAHGIDRYWNGGGEGCRQ